jgi:hypothetical protein
MTKNQLVIGCAWSLGGRKRWRRVESGNIFRRTVETESEGYFDPIQILELLLGLLSLHAAQESSRQVMPQ